MCGMTQIIDHNGHAHADNGRYTHKQNSAPAASLTAEQIRSAYAALRPTAQRLVESYRYDSSTVDDIVQDVILHVLERHERKGDGAEQVSQKTLLNMYARKFTADRGHDKQFGLRSEDMRGRRELNERVAQFETAHGRKPKPSEFKEMAHEVRMSFPAGRRPKPHFYEKNVQVSLDAPVRGADGDSTLGDMIADPADPYDFAAPDAQAREADYALHELEQRAVTRKELSRNVWAILSQRNGAPQVVPGATSQTEAKAARKTIRSAGGAGALARSWMDGETTPEQDKALFAPFGGEALDMHARERTCRVLDEYGQADRIWEESLAAASR